MCAFRMCLCLVASAPSQRLGRGFKDKESCPCLYVAFLFFPLSHPPAAVRRPAAARRPPPSNRARAWARWAPCAPLAPHGPQAAPRTIIRAPLAHPSNWSNNEVRNYYMAPQYSPLCSPAEYHAEAACPGLGFRVGLESLLSAPRCQGLQEQKPSLEVLVARLAAAKWSYPVKAFVHPRLELHRKISVVFRWSFSMWGFNVGSSGRNK